MKTIVLICGLPNAGKTTLSKNYKSVVHMDDVTVVKPKDWLPKMVKIVNELFCNDNIVVLEGTFAPQKTRETILHLLDSTNKERIYKKCIYLNISLSESIRRENRNRNISMMQTVYNQFEPPTYDEGWDKITVIN